MRWEALLTPPRRSVWRATITAYEEHAETLAMTLNDETRSNYYKLIANNRRKLLQQYLASVVIERWRRFVYKRKRCRSAFQYLTAFHFFHLSRETLANISVFM